LQVLKGVDSHCRGLEQLTWMERIDGFINCCLQEDLQLKIRQARIEEITHRVDDLSHKYLDVAVAEAKAMDAGI